MLEGIPLCRPCYKSIRHLLVFQTWMSWTLGQAIPVRHLTAPACHAIKAVKMVIICNSGASFIIFSILKCIVKEKLKEYISKVTLTMLNSYYEQIQRQHFCYVLSGHSTTLRKHWVDTLMAKTEKFALIFDNVLFMITSKCLFFHNLFSLSLYIIY